MAAEVKIIIGAKGILPADLYGRRKETAANGKVVVINPVALVFKNDLLLFVVRRFFFRSSFRYLRLKLKTGDAGKYEQLAFDSTKIKRIPGFRLQITLKKDCSAPQHLWW
jgi:hypothetical protein